ncbi:Arc family DNA-binding protein [Serratia proteamaculans]|uniref:Arc family DNA-binding protein n=1 Tax=Serratia proteamaculans TaxID=28151 RepID=UPI003D0928C3
MARPSSYPLRITDELRERLELAAHESGRSYNAELSMRLQLSVTIEDSFRIAPEYLQGYIADLEARSLLFKKVQDENESLKEQLRVMQSEFSSSFAISGSDKADIAMRKLKKAQAHIASGLDELQSLIPDNKKNT